jgi:type II secretory pathway component GspD/PulD (secretin)
VTNECAGLETQVYDLKNQMCELENVVKSIKGLSGMDDVIERLEKQSSNLEQEYRQLNRMLQALNKILVYYSKCENRILDNGEQSVILYNRKKVGTNDFSGILNILNSIHAR